MGLFTSKCTKNDDPNPPPRRGEEKTQEPTEHDRAVLKLKVARDKVTKFKTKIDKEIEKSQEMARQLVRMKKKERAMLALKRKKYLEKQYETCDAELNNVKSLLCALEFAKVQQEIAQSLDKGNKALQHLQSQLSLEDAERIMEENAEALEYVEELSEILGQGLTEEDTNGLEEQLAAMMGEAGLGDEAETPVPDLPVVPDTQTPVPNLPEVPDTPILPQLPNDLQEPTEEPAEGEKSAVDPMAI